MTRPANRRQLTSSSDGAQSVRCLICQQHLRVISGRHLSKHGIDRETYVEEYRLSPDELVAKDFRVIQSGRREYVSLGRREWLAAATIERGWLVSTNQPLPGRRLMQQRRWV
jgi:LSD1 subclass zinc finger protein